MTRKLKTTIVSSFKFSALDISYNFPFQVCELIPEHPKFQELRQKLRETKDFQGFLFNYREMVVKQSTVNKEN